MRILLSGGGGFVGQHLQAMLVAQGHQVTAPSSAAWDLRNAVRTRRVIALEEPELVFHLAARTALVAADRDPDTVRAVNVDGTDELLKALWCHVPATRLVFTSTCHVYGPPQILPVPEHHPLAPVGAYAESKRDAEDLVRASSLDTVIVRPFHLTGPGQPDTHAASDWAHQAAGGARTIRCGDLSLTRDFLDVRDACAALILVADKAPRDGTYNVCRGQEWRLADVLDAVAPGVQTETDSDRLRGHDVPRLAGDPAALEALGWTPQVPVLESLQALRRGWDARL